MDVSVVIINYNTRRLTMQCLQSIYQHTTGIDFEVILVDNASTECDPQEFKQAYPQIELIASPDNGGFSKGNNLGIAIAKGDYVLLLNSDTELTNNAIYLAWLFMQANPKVGGLSGRLLYPDGRVQHVGGRFPTLNHQLVELFRLNKGWSPEKQADWYLGDRFDHLSTREVDWVWGAFLLIPAKVIAQLPGGKMPDRFFMYAEDVEWCWYIKQLGYQIWYYHEPVCIHYISGSAKPGGNELDKHFHKILPNEYKFIALAHGVWYAKLYYYLRVLLLYTLRGAENKAMAQRYLAFLKTAKAN